MGIYSYSDSGLLAKYHTYVSNSQYSPNASKWGVHYNTELTANKKELNFTTYLLFGNKEEVKTKLLALMLKRVGNISVERVNVDTKSHNKPNGYLDGVYNGYNLYGWAIDKDDMSKPIDVHVYVDGQAGKGGKYLGKVLANVYRSDLSDSNITGNHGYIFVIPSEYRDGKSHSYYVYGIDPDSSSDNTQLSNSPKQIIIPANNMSDGGLRISSCAPDSLNAKTDTTVNWQVIARGGNPPYTYYFSDVSNVISSNNTGRISRVYKTEGQKYMSIAVIDSKNNKVDWQFCFNTTNISIPTNGANVLNSIRKIFGF